MTRQIEMIQLDPDNVKRDLASATVRGLLEQGYTVGPAFLLQEERNKEPTLALLMVPPGPQAPVQAPEPSGPVRLPLAVYIALYGALAALLGLFVLGLVAVLA